MLNLILGLAIFSATLALVMLRPGRITEAHAAAGGAVLMLALGLVQPGEAVAVLRSQWNVYGFFLGLMAISSVAEQAGIFDMMAYGAGRGAGGDARRLFLAVFAIGAVITAFLSNDATALILTPVVFTLVTRLRLPVLPFMFACTFIADTASFLLPVSNPINILVLNTFSHGLDRFLRYLLLPGLICIALNTVLFAWVFRHDLRRQFDLADLPPGVASHPAFYRFALASLGLIAVAYIAASAAGVPLSFVALGGGALLLVGASIHGRLDLSRLRRDMSWSLFVFITGMFLVIQAIEGLGVTAAFGRLLVTLAGDDPLRGILVAMGGTALGANLINNVPMTLVMISALGTIPGGVSEPVVFATMLGADLGPNLTTVGSLATILWLVILRRKGLEVSSLAYFRLGLLAVPAMVVLSALLIWWVS